MPQFSRALRGPCQSVSPDVCLTASYSRYVARRAGLELMGSLVKYFRWDFWELFDVVLVSAETGTEQVLLPKEKQAQ